MPCRGGWWLWEELLCSRVGDEALTVARRVEGKSPFVVYPRSGEVWGGNEKGWGGEGVEWVEMVEDWVKLGATIVGGCCRVGAEFMPRIEQSIVRGICR